MRYLDVLKSQFNDYVSVKEKRPGVYQLFAPLFHEDGDMIDIFLEESKGCSGRVHISDYGMTLMRLSYSYELDTPNKEKIFRRIITENGVGEDQGNLIMETDIEGIYPAILQFAQTVAKVTNMQLYKREVIHSLFYEMLSEFIDTSLLRYNPSQRVLPILERDDLEVDYMFDIKPHPIYLFGVKDSAKARITTISCLEYQRAKLKFKSFVVHENFDSLPSKDKVRITSAADKQFPSLDDFRTNAEQVLDREIA